MKKGMRRRKGLASGVLGLGAGKLPHGEDAKGQEVNIQRAL